MKILSLTPFGYGLLFVACGAMAQTPLLDRVPSIDELDQMLRSKPAAEIGDRGLDAADESSSTRIQNSPATATQSPVVAMKIQFRINSAILDGDAHEYIASVAGVLKRRPEMHLAIEGHTDASGSLDLNRRLSWERAMAVYQVLVNVHGIAPERLDAVGLGPMSPLDGKDAFSPLNRRVQFRVTG